MFWSRLGLIGLTVLWLAASTARAQTDLPLDPVAPDQTKPTETGLFLEIPSVYGTAKYDQKVNEAPAAVIIITAEQIRKYGNRNYAQILDSARAYLLTTIAITDTWESEGSTGQATIPHASCC